MVLPSGADVVAMRPSLLDAVSRSSPTRQPQGRVPVTVFMVIAVRVTAYSALTAAMGSAQHVP
jgi:hypothetical protein